MSHQTELISKLKEIFQIDRADLDFGIYKILNSRSQEIADYLQNRLPAKITAAFSQSGQAQIDGWKTELAEAEKAAAALGANPDSLPKVQELKNKIAAAQKSGAQGETAVYNHLLTFFSRYYEEGDFISQRRYKGDTYAVPYSGEEVMLHWANKDQYYTKSGENFSNYRFKVSDGMEVFFRLTAADTAKDNRKDNDAARLFVLAQERTIEQEDENGEVYEETVYPVSEVSDDVLGKKTLEIRFEYAAAPKRRKQEAENVDTVAALKTLIGEAWNAVWGKAPTDKNPNRTLLEKHLSDYTAKNSADYFIHKDLGGFLRRELDFYIKNEVMNLDNIQDAHTFANIESSLHQIQTLRTIAREIIDFLAQLEDFQKKLWLKKKFVAKSHWLITLNHIPENMLGDVFANAKQLEAWKNLFAISELPPPRDLISFAESNPYLTVDTSLFPSSFQTALLAALSQEHDLDQSTDGLLIHSDNFQALNLLQARYRGQVKCIYIDPPYNTSASEIIYKNSYKHSSWLSFLNNTLQLAKPIMNYQTGVLCGTIDDVEQKIFSQIIENNFGELAGTVAIRIKPSGRPIPNGFALSHEYAIFARRNPNFPIARLSHNEEQKARYREKDKKGLFFWELFRKAGSNSNRENRPTMFYPFYLNSETMCLRLPEMTYSDKYQKYDIQENPKNNEVVVYPIKDDGSDGCWYFGLERALTIKDEFKAVLQNDGTYRIYYRRRPNDGIQPTSLWFDARYSATEHGTALLKNLFGEQETFSYPKSIYAVEDCLTVSGAKLETTATILDYFGGSGTTAHAVINLNREDGGRRKYILVEQGEYFDTVLKPRVQKVVYSANWKDGKPVPSDTSSENGTNPYGGVSQIVKVLKLESYEDTLNNLALKDNSDLFDRLPENVREDYLLRYLLDDQSRGSLLNTEVFRRPFDYQMDIATTSAGATERVNIDLMETFNYLLGLRVIGIADGVEKRGYLTVEGASPDGEKVLVIWRDCDRVDYDGLNALLGRLKINPQDSEYGTVYINGDHNIATVWESENGVTGRLKIRQIESEFLALMFEGAE